MSQGTVKMFSMITLLFITFSYLGLLAYTAGIMPGVSLGVSVSMVVAAFVTLVKPSAQVIYGLKFFQED